MMMKLSEILAPFKDREHEWRHAAVALIEDEDAQLVLSAFSLMPPPVFVVPHEGQRLLLDQDVDDRILWDTLWEWTTVDIGDLGDRAADMGHDVARSLLKRLISARLIYPDGTASTVAKIILNSRVTDFLRRRGVEEEGEDE
jgi:hypothetical protein